MKTPFLALIAFLFAGIISASGQDIAVVNDLRADWNSYEEGKFISFASRETPTDVVYFNVAAKDHRSQSLRISSSKDMSIFINNSLAAVGRHFVLNIDSVAREFSSSNLVVAVYQKHLQDKNLVTEIVENRKPAFESSFFKREGSAINDFAITGMLMLMIFAIIIIRQNPKLAGDYFSASKIVSSREIDEGQTSTRIGSSTNILFYAYTSMLVAYYLMIIFHFVPERYSLASSFVSDNYILIVLDWLKLSSLLLVLMFIKIIIVFAISYLFGFSEVAGFHFFNWIRLMLVVFGILVLIVFMYLTWHGHNAGVYITMLKLLGWFTIGWIIVIFLKLSGKVGASMFNLFSYICATELIPFLFIIKVLYN